MTYYSSSFRTWIALRGAPLQMWSRSDIVRLVQDFSLCTTFRGIQGNQTDTREGASENIVKEILFREGQYATFIEVCIHD
jgi:hypothetical protein